MYKNQMLKSMTGTDGTEGIMICKQPKSYWFNINEHWKTPTKFYKMNGVKDITVSQLKIIKKIIIKKKKWHNRTEGGNSFWKVK